MRFLGTSFNGIAPNGLILNGVTFNGLWPNSLTTNGLTGVNLANFNEKKGWNSLFVPSRYSKEEVGSNWINSDLLGPLGVGELKGIASVENNRLDNRHIPEDLKSMLCREEATENSEETSFSEYFAALIDLAWPGNAELWICCSEPAGANATAACVEPDYTFNSQPEDDGLEPPVYAPHFLTEKFETGQQEALTAALIAKLNVHGQTLIMDLHGRLDLGLAGTKFMADRVTGFDYYLGNAWGNAFLDCFGEDMDHVLCQASAERDHAIGRDSQFFGLPMFTCSGASDYPTRESGKACFSKDMETNEHDGCGMVASVGVCDRVCVAGFCGVNDPPLEHQGSTNVLYVYMPKYKGEEQINSGEQDILKVLIPVLSVLLLALVALFTFMMLKKRKAKTASAPVDKATSDAATTVSVEEEA